ncbi:MAG: sigma 54-interacting transcriptional regulator [Planctomycetota bacterium]|jgi:transcriptional regulator with GAF, ATPase, and Fis domain
MRLTVIEDGVRADLALDKPAMTVGRSVDNDIRLQSSRVSRHHTRIELIGDEAWIVDLGSANGTLVNGERVDRQRVGVGDRICVGGVDLILEEDPAGGPAADGSATLTGDAGRERETLRVFASITRELNSEVDLPRLLRLVVDSAVALVGAERGFVLLEDEAATARRGDGPPDVEHMSVSVARNFDESDIVVPRSRLSMGIAGRALSTGRPVLSVNASEDDRFDGMASVEHLRLRSVMCLPILDEGRPAGVLYVDNRLQRGAFGAADLELMELFSGQASSALRNARLVGSLREQNRRLEASRLQIERLNEQLGRKVRDQGSELAVVRKELDRERSRYDYGQMVGASDPMRAVFRTLDRVVESDLPVLIHGESGTGKELIARAVHRNGARRERPFVTENCAALPDTLLESELFGHVRGAFTGAYRAKKGLLEQADGGTLFLDEIGDMSPEMQKKLLRVLQEGEFRVLGSDRVVQVDVRVLTASHRDLQEMVREGTFREDLFYRVAVLTVDLPPLRSRRDDIPLLAEHLLLRAAREAGRDAPGLPHDVLSVLCSHDWPGNVRELENEMRRLLVVADEEVRVEHLSRSVVEGQGRESSPAEAGAVLESGDIRSAVADLERRSIEAALAQAGGNKSRASAALGISRFALQRKLDKYGIGKTRRRGSRQDGEGEA